MTNNSIKIKQMKLRIEVTNVRRHSGAHTFSDNAHCVRSFSV